MLRSSPPPDVPILGGSAAPPVCWTVARTACASFPVLAPFLPFYVFLYSTLHMVAQE